MTWQETASRLNRDIEARRMVVLLCTCEIEYKGRSRSNIGAGHRIILIKQDSTIIVHSITGFKPVNWMNTPAETVAEAKEEGILLYSQRTKPPYEEMKIKIKEILDYKSYASLRDDEKLDLTHTERDLQEYLVKNTQLIDQNFRLISTEHPTPLGFLDLYGKIGETYVIVELKVERAGLPAALQIKRYVDWLRGLNSNVKGILMAPGITPNALGILKKERIEYKKIDVHHLNIRPRREKTLREWF